MSSDPDTLCSDWRALAKQLQAKLQQIEFVYDAGFSMKMCPECEYEKPEHADDCELAALLATHLDEVVSNRVIAFDAEGQAARVDNQGLGEEHMDEEQTGVDPRARGHHADETSKTTAQRAASEAIRKKGAGA